MATIENLGNHGELRAFLQQLGEPELLAQQISQQGAIHALEFILANGGSVALTIEMLASLRRALEIVATVAEDKGFTRLFGPSATGLH